MSKRALEEEDVVHNHLLTLNLLEDALPRDVLDIVVRVLVPTTRWSCNPGSHDEWTALPRLSRCSSGLHVAVLPLLPALRKRHHKYWCYLCHVHPTHVVLGCTGTEGCVLERDEEEEDSSSSESSIGWGDPRVICSACRKWTCASCKRGYCGCVALVEECQVCQGQVCARCVDNCDLFDYEQMCCYQCRIGSDEDDDDEEDDDDDEEESAERSDM